MTLAPGHESCRASTALSPIHRSYLKVSVKGVSMWNCAGLLWPQRLPEIIFTTGSNPVLWDDPAQAGRLDQVIPVVLSSLTHPVRLRMVTDGCDPVLTPVSWPCAI